MRKLIYSLLLGLFLLSCSPTIPAPSRMRVSRLPESSMECIIKMVFEFNNGTAQVTIDCDGEPYSFMTYAGIFSVGDTLWVKVKDNK